MHTLFHRNISELFNPQITIYCIVFFYVTAISFILNSDIGYSYIRVDVCLAADE